MLSRYARLGVYRAPSCVKAIEREHSGKTHAIYATQYLGSALRILLCKLHIPVQAARVGHRILVDYLLKRLTEQ
jgi:hypothetical protein